MRTGRASVSMLDHLTASYYGTPTPLKALATVTVPDAAQIVIQPFDTNALKEIVKAIRESDLGFNPSDDGQVIRLSVPPLTSERRDELVKKVGKMAEEARIALRSIRGDIWEEIQKAQKDALISEDNREWGRGEIDKITSDFNKQVESLAKEKEVEIRTI